MQSFQYSIKQIEEKELLKPERIQEIKTEIQNRILPVKHPITGEILKEAVFFKIDDKLYLQSTANQLAYENIEKILIHDILTPEEQKRIKNTIFNIEADTREKKLFDNAEKIPAEQWDKQVIHNGQSPTTCNKVGA